MTKKKILIGLAASFILVGIFFYSLVFNINQPLGLRYTDGGGEAFVIKSNMDKMIAGDFSHLASVPMFYGFKNTLFYSNNLLFQSVLSLPGYLITHDASLSYNIFAVATIFFSFFSMYCLALYFTGNVLASVFASVVFVFNPYIMGQFPDGLELYSLQWLPLIVLFFELFLDKGKNIYAFLVMLFITFQLLSSLYYFVFIVIIYSLYFSLRLWQRKKNPLVFFENTGFLTGLAVFFAVLGPLAYLYTHFSPLKLTLHQDLNALTDLYSPYILNWFTTPPENIMYGSIGSNLRSFAPAFFSNGHNDVVNLFFGFTPLVIFLICLRTFKKSKNESLIKIFLLLFFISLIVSFGPKIQLNLNISLPNPLFRTIMMVPWFDFIRVPARKAVFVFFFLALIGAFTLKSFREKIGVYKFYFLGLLIILLTIAEYFFMPMNVKPLTAGEKQFFSYLKNDRKIKVIIDMPVGNGLPEDSPDNRAITADGLYLYLNIFHGKTLFEGYSSYISDDYINNINYVSQDFPKKNQLLFLKNKGVDAIVLHKNQYPDPSRFSKIKNELVRLKVPILKDAGSLILFDLSDWPRL